MAFGATSKGGDLSAPRPRVAMLVHNAVVHDARVLKEARSLYRQGYVVEVHGFDPKTDEKIKTVPGTDVQIFLNSFTEPSADSIGQGSERIRNDGRFTKFAREIVQYAYRVAGQSEYATRGLRWLHIAAKKVQVASRRTVNRAKTESMPFTRYLKNIADRMLPSRMRGRRFRKIAERLIESIGNRPKPDVIHLHDTIALVAARELRQTYPDATTVWDAHEIYEDLAQAPPYLSRLNASIIREASDCIDRFITISDSFADFYASSHKKLPRPAIVIRNATEIMPPRADDGRLHDAAGLPASQRIALYQGGFVTHRGLEALVASATHLDHDWSVVMMGWGPIEEKLKDIARAGPDRDIPPVCFIPGAPQADLPYWTAGATVGVIPYEDHGLNHRYCTPNKLWEYPNARVPIVASDLVEIRRTLDDWSIGWCLPKSPTPQDIADLINGLSEEEIAQARKACAKFVESDNWGVYEKRLVKLYSEIACPPAPQQ